MALSSEAQVGMFGSTIEEMEAEGGSIAARNYPDFPGYIASILSDAQEAMARGHVETASQWLNKAKYFLTEKMSTR